MVGQGVASVSLPMAFHFSMWLVVMVFKPAVKLPSPKYINAKNGTSNAPTTKITALIVSDTATAFKPPKIA